MNGERRRRALGLSVATLLLTWLPAVIHDVGGDPMSRAMLSMPSVLRAALLTLGVWAVLCIAIAALTTLLAPSTSNPAVASVGGLAVTALTLILREWAQKRAIDSALEPEFGTLLLILGAILITGGLWRLVNVVRSPSWRRFVGRVTACLCLLAIAVQFWQQLDAGVLRSQWPSVLALPLLSSAVLVCASPQGRSWRILSTVVGSVTLSCMLLFFVAAEKQRPSVAPPPNPSDTGKPNVVVFMIDTLRADHTGTGGYERDTTPVLDQAANGHATVFSRAIATAPFTKPSVTSLFTAKLADPELLSPEPDAQTIARTFWDSGYHTGAFSSNHLIAGPGFESGFQTFYSTSVLRVLQRSYLFGELLAGGRMLGVFRLADRLGAYKVPGRELTAAALRWVDTLGDGSFFLYVHSIDPHWPYRDRGYGLLPEEVRGMSDAISLSELLNIQKRAPENVSLLDDARTYELLGRYDEEVRHADRALGELLAGLRSRGLRKETLVVVVGDHGEEFFERGGLGHGKGVEEFSVHVPLVFLWPEGDRFASFARRVGTPISLLDVYPTLSDLLALPLPPDDVLGTSLRWALENRGNEPLRPVVAESLKGENIASSYREGALKVHVVYSSAERRFEDSKVEVFDLDQDPYESRPLDIDNELASLVSRAHGYLEQVWAPRRGAGDTPPEETPESPDREVIERLRALGYLK